MRSVVAILILLGTMASARAGDAAALERGTAITDPPALRELDHGRFGLGRLMGAEPAPGTALANDRLFALPSLARLRSALDGELDRYVARHRANSPNETIGVGDGFAFQLFDRSQIYSPLTRFVLAGIVNRMDRAYVSEADCGEIRLIYRLVREEAASVADASGSRLPMTLNVVLKAKGNAQPIDCAEIARRWLAAGDLTATGEALAEKLLSGDGPLDLVVPENIDRIETNLQIAYAPKSPTRDFRTDYLLKVFRTDAGAGSFEETVLENQIDRERLLADQALGSEFKAWLLDAGHLSAFDRGTVLIPEKFLARAAIATTPAGFDPSELQPEFGLVQDEGPTGHAVFTRPDVVAALEKATHDGVALQNIRSVGGFARRLNDITCAGCHQTRGIGGFHFPGVDWLAAKPSNSAAVPASPHFYGDQIRRRDILTAWRDGRPADYSRGFSDRPQSRHSTELSGTEYQDGWGSHCYASGTTADEQDRSFRGWTCAEGLSCQIVGKTSRMGMCFVKSR